MLAKIPPFEEYAKNINILVVEDSDSSLEQLLIVLDGEFGSVYSAGDGAMALEVFEREKIDIIVTDIQMPNLGGLGLAEKIRYSTPDIPIIFLSAFTDAHYLLTAMSLGVDGYILKPIDPVSLIAVIKKAAARLYIEYSRELYSKARLQDTIIRSKTALLKDIAHHWRNPLAIAHLYMQEVKRGLSFLMEEPILDGSAQSEWAGEMVKSVEASLAVMQELSGVISRFSGVLSDQTSGEISIAAAAKSAIEFCKPMCDEAGVLFVGEIGGNGVGTVGHFGVIELVVYQLVKNSLEAISEGGRQNGKISLKIGADNGTLSISCEDNGKGIDGFLIDSVCEPYVSSKVQPHGQGTGLFLVLQMVEENLGGQLTWCNLENGAGFYIKAPIGSLCV